MISLLRKLLAIRSYDDESLDMLRDAVGIMQSQRDMLQRAAQEIAVWQDRALNAQRATRDLAIAFRAQQDLLDDDVDIRGDLDQLVQELCDSVAQLEEHLPY